MWKLGSFSARYWAWRRQRAEKALAKAYLRTAPAGSPASKDPFINAHYARMRETPQEHTPAQMMALGVQQQTLARANDPPRTSRDQHFVEERSDHDGGGNIGHFDEPTVRVRGMLPPMKGKDE